MTSIFSVAAWLAAELLYGDIHDYSAQLHTHMIMQLNYHTWKITRNNR